MKVIEKGTDRKAQVSIFVEGGISALREYGEYIDATDKTICCYVPLDEGHKPRIGGRFSGTVSIACRNSTHSSNEGSDPGCSL
jgi:hypothetical protein